MMRKHIWRKVLAIGLIVLLPLTLVGCGDNSAKNIEDYPTKSITVMVGFNPGGGVDTAVRGIQPYLQKYIGKTVLVENKPGNQGLIAMNYVGEQKPDGYTLIATTNAMSLNAMIFPESYKLKAAPEEALIPIYSWVNGDGNGIFVSKESAIKTWDDLVAKAQTEEGIKIAGSGIGSTDHITAITLTKIYGGKWTFVPMDSAGEVASAVLGGQVDAGSSSPGAASLDPSRVNMLAVTLKERAEKWPDAPTFIELEKPELYILFVIGLMAPAGTPPEIIAKLEDAMDQARNDQAFIDWAENAKQPIGKEGWKAETYKSYLTDYQTNMKALVPDIQEALKAAQGGQ
ncbi:MAG: tripartite tricarboxylate transporter substrate binding protein [Dehalobacter sp.]|nr:tripartite tricarboxylate transporter substrate binding protein [Dehalobacter sp.]